MNIAIVVDNPISWFVPFARELNHRLQRFGVVTVLQSAADILPGNGVSFLLSCESKVPKDLLARSRNNIVVHASDLPKGKGMSPLTWQILEGENTIPITLFEAVEAIDAGTIYLKDSIALQGNELLHEIQAALGTKIIHMCERFMDRYPGIVSEGIPQDGTPTFYRRRTADDSRLDPERTLAEQFNLLRVVDNEQYPAFFVWQGRRFTLKIDVSL
ncbi:MAG: formyltransferase family protein [Verrucomicrobiota bacterium]